MYHPAFAFVPLVRDPGSPQGWGQSPQTVAKRTHVLGPPFGTALFIGNQAVESFEQLRRFSRPLVLFLEQLTDRYSDWMRFNGCNGALVKISLVSRYKRPALPAESRFASRSKQRGVGHARQEIEFDSRQVAQSTHQRVKYSGKDHSALVFELLPQVFFRDSPSFPAIDGFQFDLQTPLRQIGAGGNVLNAVQNHRTLHRDRYFF
jgi:hypothetical protein